MTKITAVIPIRSGSQRVKDKNLRPFANTSYLLCYTWWLFGGISSCRFRWFI